jgi:hypothetical protein
MPDLDPASVIEAIAADQRLRVFVRSGRIETLPAKRSRRRLLLDKIAQGFEPGVRYPEHRVSRFLEPSTPTTRRCGGISSMRNCCPGPVVNTGAAAERYRQRRRMSPRLERAR